MKYLVFLFFSLTAQAGTVEVFETSGGTPTVYHDCTTNYWFLSDTQDNDQIEVTCSNTPPADIIEPGADREIFVNGKTIQCPINDALFQNNTNFVIRLNCFSTCGANRSGKK